MNNEVVGTGIEITGLAEGIYRTVIFDANDCEFETPEYLLSLTSIAEIEPSQYSIYPNPTNEVFNIQSDERVEDLKVKLVSVSGEDVTTMVDFALHETMIKRYTKGLITGLYYLELSKTEGNEVVRTPIIILD